MENYFLYSLPAVLILISVLCSMVLDFNKE
jgi:hypothetical protein